MCDSRRTKDRERQVKIGERGDEGGVKTEER